jgi:eukaryotic-like serine/threonine-protein kinase
MNKVFCLTLTAAALFTPAAFAQNMFRGNPAHNPAVCEETSFSFDKPAWIFKTGGPVVSSAAVANGVVYFGSDDRNLYAADIATGAKKWSFATGGRIRSTPAVADGVVYFICGDSKIYALEAATGAKKWEFLTSGERNYEAKGIHGNIPATQTMPDFWDVYESSPAVVGGVVYVGCGDGNLYALDAATGELRWKFATGEVVHSSPAVVDGVVYFGGWDTFLHALDAKTGAEIWRFKTGEDAYTHNQTGIQGSPVVKDGVVYFGCRDSNVYALDAKTGAKKWAYSNNGTWVNCSPVVADGTVCFVTSMPGFFIILDAASGVEKAKIAVPFILFSSPTISGGKIYAGSFDGVLYFCDPKTGTADTAFATKASLDHKSEFYNPDGSLNTNYIFRNNDFEDMYFSACRMLDSGAVISSPVIAGGRLFIGSCDGGMYCFQGR